MESESSVIRLRRKLSELSREYSKEKQAQPRSRSVNSRPSTSDLNGSFRSRRTKRKGDVLRTQIDIVTQDNYLKSNDFEISQKEMIPTRDKNNINLKKKSDEQNLVTVELVQVLHSKQTRIDELEQRLKNLEQQESQWKIKYEQECNHCELLQSRIIDLEQELFKRRNQSNILNQLQTDVKRLHSAFEALEVENTQLTAQLSLARDTRLSSQLDKFRHELAQTCHESLC